MASAYFPLKNAETPPIEAIARILRNGSMHDMDDPENVRAAEFVARAGLTENQTFEYVQCANPRDDDYRYVHDRSCRGRIRINDDLDEACDSFRCPECGRAVYPRTKTRRRMIQVAVRRENIAVFLEGILTQSSLSWKQVNRWVWRVDTSKGEAKLVVVDYCDTEYLSREWAIANRTCYIVVDSASCKRRFLPETWLAWSRLADIVCRPNVLVDLLSSSATMTPSSIIHASVPVYSATVRPVVQSGSGNSGVSETNTFPTPRGASWEDVEIRFKDGDTVSVRVRSVTTVLTYTEMGMSNKKNRKPTVQWELLRAFADEEGTLTWSSKHADRKKQKRREMLSRDLQQYFQIGEDPFCLTKDRKGWRSRFSISWA